MLETFAKTPRSNLRRNLRVAGLLLATLPASVCAPSAYGQNIYLVSGTPTNKGPETFPSYLLHLDANGHLETIRTLSPAESGLYSVESTPDGLTGVAYPHVQPTTVSIVHPEDPLRADVIAFNPKAADVEDDATALVKSPAGDITWFFSPIAASDSVPGGPALRVSLSAKPGTSASMVSGVQSEDQIIDLGVGGGPAFNFSLSANVAQGRIVAPLGPPGIAVDILPKDLAHQFDGTSVFILASTSDYLVFTKGQSMDELEHAGHRMLYVHNRKSGTWKQIAQEGNISRARLSGPWVCSITQYLRPTEGSTPETAAEQEAWAGESKTTRTQYASYQGSISTIPGVLVLDNLDDGRHLVIKTGREDSEVLIAASKELIYRENDSLYRLPIDGNRLGAKLLMARDPRLESVHWAFYAPGLK